MLEEEDLKERKLRRRAAVCPWRGWWYTWGKSPLPGSPLETPASNTLSEQQAKPSTMGQEISRELETQSQWAGQR